MISWDAVNGISSALTTVVVAATAVAGYRQIRLAGAQVRHLRQATQLQATMAVFDELTEPSAAAQWEFVVGHLRERMDDPAYRAAVSGSELPAEADHPEVAVLRRFEKLGTYVKNGLLEGDVLYDFFGGAWIRCWNVLVETGCISGMRSGTGPSLWENAEFLYRESVAFAARRGWHEAPGEFERKPTDAAIATA
jgi:hypothetical protein